MLVYPILCTNYTSRHYARYDLCHMEDPELPGTLCTLPPNHVHEVMEGHHSPHESAIQCIYGCRLGLHLLRYAPEHLHIVARWPADYEDVEDD